MKRVTVTELKSRLSEFLRLVKRGTTIEILERSVPIARIEGIRRHQDGADARIERLVREGVLTPPRHPLPRGFLQQPPVPCDADIVQILIEERGDR